MVCSLPVAVDVKGLMIHRFLVCRSGEGLALSLIVVILVPFGLILYIHLIVGAGVTHFLDFFTSQSLHPRSW